MTPHRATRSYDFHGLRIAVVGDAAVLTAVDARLRHFAQRDDAPPDVHFEYRAVPAGCRQLVVPPAGRSRVVYEPAAGTVRYYDATDQLYIDDGDRIRALCDLGTGQVRVSVCRPQPADAWLLSHPIITLPLIELLKRRGCYSLHSAGLSLGGRGLLLPAASGSGKSTLALALLRAGFDFLGDDMMFLTPDGDGLRVLAFPDEIDVTDETARFFPELHDVAQGPLSPGWPKRPLRVEDRYEAATVMTCRPSALVFPRISGTRTSVLSPMPRDDALLAIVPNVLLTQARAAQAHLDVLAQIVQTIPCYRLDTGRDFDRIPVLLRALLT